MIKLAALVVLASCVGLDEPVSEETAQGIEPPELRCDVWGCGHNSPLVGDGIVFDELDRRGVEPNRSGVSLVEARLADGTPVKVWVDRHYLKATSIADSALVYEGYDLIGMIVTLHQPARGYYELRIDSFVESLGFWTGDTSEEIPFYDIKVRRLGAAAFKDHICINSAFELDPRWSGVAHSAIVFQWDRYDPVHKRVTETALDDPWFNIACAGSTPAKLHFLRHTRAGTWVRGVPTYDVPVARRQAMLKNLTADYCGDGRSYTEHGHALRFEDSYFHYSFDAAAGWGPTESIWTADGALCLDTPRFAARGDIACGAALPGCGWSVFWWSLFGPVISANPP